MKINPMYSSNLLHSSTVVIILIFFIGTLQCEAQSNKTLDKLDLKIINKLHESKKIKIESIGWSIDPDVWNYMGYNDRKGFAKKLSIYYFNYTKVGKKADGFCFFL